MSSNAQLIRQLQIKTGVVKRLVKDEQVYREEAVEQEKVLTKLRQEQADGADIRNAERVLKDAEQMIPRTRKSIEEAVTALEDLVNALKTEEVAGSSEYKAAEEQLRVAGEAQKSNGNA